MSLDQNAELTYATLSAPDAETSTVTGSGVDIRDYIGSIKITQDVGTVGGTSPTLDGKIQDSADNSTFADVSGATFTQVTSTGNQQSITLDTRSVQRYIRYVGTIAGTSPAFDMGASLVGKKQVR